MISTKPEDILARGRVPRDPFREVLLDMMERHNFTTQTTGMGGPTRSAPLEGKLPLSSLADLAGVPVKTLNDFLLDRYESYGFDFCDRVLCALGGPLSWWSPKLRPIFEAINLLKLDIDDAVQEAGVWAYEGLAVEQT